jgi:RHS repeat-associated protein
VLIGTLLTTLLAVGVHAQVPADRCIEDGGTAICRGPELGTYSYSYCDSEQLCNSGFSTEADAVEDLRKRVHNEFSLCSSYVEHPGFTTLPTQLAQSAPGTSFYPAGCNTAGGVCHSFTWDLGEEVHQQQANPVNVRGIDKNSSGACVSSFTYQINQIDRGRVRACPSGFARNTDGIDSLYCWKAPGNDVDVRKNLGKQCDVPHVGHPINALTGNKYLEVPLYRGSGAFPLEFTLIYNSLSHTASGTPASGPTWVRARPNWRFPFSRAVLVNEHPRFKGATVYRHDGRVLYYTLVGAQYVSDADIDMKLERLADPISGAWTGWRLINSADETEMYDVDGRLLSITDRGGLQHTLTYSHAGNNRVLSIKHTNGTQILFDHSSGGYFNGITLPDGGKYTFGLDSYNNITSVTGPDQYVRTFNYQNTTYRRALTRVLDENNAVHALYTYGSGGRAMSTELAGGVDRYTMVYTSDSRTTVTDPLLTTRTYDNTIILGMKHPTETSSACPSCGGTVAKSNGYDANGNVSSRIDFNNNETRYTYDLTRNLQTSRTEAFGSTRARTIDTQWHPAYRLPTQVDEPGKRTTFGYDASGNLTARTELDTSTSESRTWSYTYNSVGQVLTADGPRTDVADVTTYTYYTCTTGYQCGQVETITNALGQVTTYNTYNAHGQPLTITDPNGVVTTLTYDPRQRLTSRTVGSEQTTFEYWPTGLLKKATLPDGSYIEYAYDAAHRLTGVNDSQGNRIAYTLNAMGNRTKEDVFDPANALTQTRTRVFNTLNRLTQEIAAAGTPAVTTTFGYDDNGNQTNINAPLGRSTVQAFDELNRLTTVTDPATGITSYGYNALDQLISVTDPRTLATTYAYNALGDLQQQVSPDTGTTTNTYDSGGNLKTSTNARGIITTYTYDALNRLKSAAFKLGTTTDQTITYNYDAGTNGKGHLSSASDASHSMAWTYDAQGRVTGKSQVVGAITHSVGYGYLNGQLTAVTTPSGQTITYGYTNNQVTSIQVNGTSVLSSVIYEPFGPPKQWTWGNGTQSSRTYDQDGKVTQITGPVTTTYGYDDAFRITGITDTTNSALSWLYGYDNLDRLTSASKTGTTIGYTYDANGNRLSQTGTSATTYTIAANSNRVTATSGALARTYGYNSDGNVNSYTGIVYAYNNRGRIKSSTKSGVTTNYTYNALGELVKKSTGMYVYDEAGHVLGQYTTAGVLTSEIVWLGDMPVATIRPASGGGVEVFYIHTDHLNTPRVVTQPSNNAQRWRWDSNPFGSTANDNPSGLGVFTLDLRFPGQIAMPESGLYQNYFRDYDYQTGRYVQSDPIGVAGGINTYVYVKANPLASVDPSGLQIAAGARIGGAIGTAVEPGGGTAVGAAIGAAIGVGIVVYQTCKDEPCPPCKTVSGRIVPVGTIGYRRMDTPPPGKVEHGIEGPHFNIYKANQAPRNSPKPCKCFWQSQGAVAPAALPAGAIPIEVFAD